MQKTLSWDSRTKINVQLWDVAGALIHELNLISVGQDRFASMVRAFYSNANGALVIFDVVDPTSFEGAALWKKDIDEKLETKIPVILVANKIDLVREDERMKLRQEIEEFSRYVFQCNFY